MAKNTFYGRETWPAMGAYLFSGSFLQRMFSRFLQGGISAEDTITAHAGGLQPSAYQLTNSLNRVSVVASGGDSIALPPAIQGSIVIVDNGTATSMNVFAKVGTSDTINGTAGTTAFAHAGNKRISYQCVTKGAWQTSTAAIP